MKGLDRRIRSRSGLVGWLLKKDFSELLETHGLGVFVRQEQARVIPPSNDQSAPVQRSYAPLPEHRRQRIDH
ncbi:MAG: hypothetical protein WAT33_12475 [Giesbergeria sp.]